MNFVSLFINNGKEYIFRRFKVLFFKKNTILLIPPTSLNGGFGDDIMVSSVYHFYVKQKIILFTDILITRNDLFSSIIYQKWGTRIFWNSIKKVLLLGADNLSGTYGNKEVLKKLEILKSANNYNIKSDILGFSLSKDTTDLVKKNLFSISNFTKFKIRDPNSYNRALTFLPAEKVEQVADVAFLCPLVPCNNQQYIHWTEKQKSEKRKIIAICPNSIHMRNYKDDEYINQYVHLIENINKNGLFAFVILYHDLRLLNKEWSDMKISEEINKRINSENIYFTPDIINGVQLKSYLPYVDITLTSRMHLGISGYSLCKPMFGITYENKFSGLQKLFNISPERSLVEFTSIENTPEIFNKFMLDYDKNEANVKRSLPSVLELSKKNFL